MSKNTNNWKKEFNKIDYYQRVKRANGKYIFVCQNSHLIEVTEQALSTQRKELLEEIEKILYEMENHISGEDCLLFFASRIRKKLNQPK